MRKSCEGFFEPLQKFFGRTGKPATRNARIANGTAVRKSKP